MLSTITNQIQYLTVSSIALPPKGTAAETLKGLTPEQLTIMMKELSKAEQADPKLLAQMEVSVAAKVKAILTAANVSPDEKSFIDEAMAKEAAGLPLTAKEKKVVPEVLNLYKDVMIYGIVQLWTMTRSSMNNIDAATKSNQSLLLLDQQTELNSESWSTLYTSQLQADVAAITAAAAVSGAPGVPAATAQFNSDNTLMQTFASFFSGVHNLVNNQSTSIVQVIGIDLNCVSQGILKFLDTLTQMIATIY